jgi:O-antigen/teichoic acid export membrane protein
VSSVSDFKWLLVERAVRITTTLIVTATAARILGPNGFGIMCFGIALGGVLMITASFGLRLVINQIFVDLSTVNNVTANVAICVQLVAGVVSYLVYIGILTTLFKFEPDIALYAIVSGFPLILTFHQVGIYWLESKQKFRQLAQLQITGLAITLPLKLIAILSENPLLYFALTLIFEATVFTSLVCKEVGYSPSMRKPPRLNYRQTLIILSRGFPLMLSALAFSSHLRIDQVLLAALVKPSELGQYNAAILLSEALLLFPMLIMTVCFPELVKRSRLNLNALFKRTRRILALIITTLTLVAILTTFAAEWIIRALFGAAYTKTATILSIQIWAILFSAIGIVTDRIYIIEKRNWNLFQKNLFGLIISLALGVTLIPAYAIHGAAYAMLISSIITNIFYDVIFKETRPLFINNIRALSEFTFSARVGKRIIKIWLNRKTKSTH